MVKKILLGMLLFGMNGMTSISWAGGSKGYDPCIPAPLAKDLEKLDRKQSQSEDALIQSYTCTWRGPMTAPEMDPSSAIVGLTLLLGGVAVIRGRRMATSASHPKSSMTA